MRTKTDDSEPERETSITGSLHPSSRTIRLRPPPPRSRHLLIEESLAPEDFRSLVHISTARIACFDFETPIPTSTPRQDFSRLLYETGSRCIEASLTFALGANRATVDDIIGLSLSELLPRSFGYDAVFEKWRDQQLSGQSFEVEVLDSDCSRLVMQSVLYARLQTDSFARLWVILRDVTVHARAVQALARAELHYRSLVERPGQILARIRPDGHHEYVSPSVEALFGITSRQLLLGADPISERIHPDDEPRHNLIRQARTSGMQEPIETELRLQLREGQYHWFFIRQCPKFSHIGEIEYFDVIAIDVQGHKDLEQAASRTRATGPNPQLAAGLAHDINNHLTALIGQLDAALGAAEGNAPVREPLLVARAAALAATQMTKKLGGTSTNAHLPCDATVGTLLRQASSLVQHLIPANTKLILSEAAPELIVCVDPVQMQQVLLNLLLNARDAMPNGGELRLGASICGDGEGITEATDRHVRIDVTDTGSGISADLRERIFEPFFTTKSEGRGTGLGLAMVKDIVSSYGGWVDLRSTEGEGSTFSVFLPLVTRAVEVGSNDPDAFAYKSHFLPVTTTPISIVVVDDDDMVRAMLLSALSKLGLDVVGVADGRSLSKLAESPHFPHDVILLDDSMPYIRGSEMVSHLRALWPDAAIILTSGDASVRESVQRECENVTFLEKPFTLEELLEVVRTLNGASKSKGVA